MPSASIRSLVNGGNALTSVSRDDLQVGSVVTLESANIHSTYSWTLAFKPLGSAATFSSSPNLSSPGSFTVDKEGPYLIRLTADLGLGTESTQYVRLRALTVFGELKLVAAGEGYGGSIPVPVDTSSTGWSDQQNYNMQTVLGLVARASTSGRVLFVDANAGTHYSTGRIVVSGAPLTPGDTITINGVTLSGSAGARVPGNNDFNALLTNSQALVADIVAAINDPANGFAVSVVASATTSVVNIVPVTVGAFVALTVATSNVDALTVGQGHGDFSTIQSALDAADALATSTDPYVVVVRPGLYVENLTFRPFVHVVGWSGNVAGADSHRGVVLRGSHQVDAPASIDQIVLAWLTLENITSNANATLLVSAQGTLTLYRCEVVQNGLGVLQGPALRVSQGTVLVDSCVLSAHSSLTDDRAALTQTGTSASTVTVLKSMVRGPTAVELNAALNPDVETEFRDTRIVSTGGSGVGILSDAESLLLEYCRVEATSGVPLQIHPGAGVFATGIACTLRWSYLNGPIDFDITGIAGTTSLSIGSSEYTSLSFPGGTPTNLTATTKSTSLFYDNSTSGLTAENVQDALDEIYAEATLVRTLDDAYDGGVSNSGSGRTIIADQGSVRIVDAPVSSDPPPASNTNGRLEVVSSVRVGALGFPEIDLDPNPYGSGPSVLLGNRVVPGNVPFGVGTAMVMSRSTGSPLYRNYNLRVQTQSSLGGGQIGRLILQGGEGLNNGVNTPDAASVYLQAGTAFNVAASPGSIYIAPGRQVGGTSGSVFLVHPDGNTSATLTAAGVCSDPIGVSGTVTFATNMGAVTATLVDTDSLATVVSKLDALDGLSAAESLGVITLTTEHQGPNAEVYFLSASAGIDTALGGFDGQSQVNGDYGDFIEIQASADQEISFGLGGSTGPMVYNADTGKLTVPGLIDPTGMVFELAAAPSTGPTEGAIFVSDGTGGLDLNGLYYRGPNDAVPVKLA